MMKKKTLLPAILAVGLLSGIPAQAKWGPVELVDNLRDIVEKGSGVPGLVPVAQAIDDILFAAKVIVEERDKKLEGKKIDYKRVAAALTKAAKAKWVLEQVQMKLTDPIAKAIGTATSIIKKGSKEQFQNFWKKVLNAGFLLAIKQIDNLVKTMDPETKVAVEKAVKQVREATEEEKQEAMKMFKKKLFGPGWPRFKKTIAPPPAGVVEETEVIEIDKI